MLKKTLIILSVVLMAAFALSITASADIGPKPSLHVTFTNLPYKTYYAVILSPMKENDFNSEDQMNFPYGLSDEKKHKIFKAFSGFEDSDGYKLWSFIRDISSQHNTISISSYFGIPKEFKVLLYEESDDCFFISTICHTSQLSSKYTVDFSKTKDIIFTVDERYDKLVELMLWILRLVLTIAIEILIAIPFGFGKKKQMISIVFINTVTQIYLNFALGINYYLMGEPSFVIIYFISEIVVTITEGIYYRFCKNMLASSGLRTSVYALVSNMASFGIGVL
jgi:hypothetical protein